MNEQSILKIAANHIEKGGYVVYYDFSELKPANQSGRWYWFPIKDCLLEHGYSVHESRHRADWNNCGYSGDKTHFHKN